jgi:hypothetical protein
MKIYVHTYKHICINVSTDMLTCISKYIRTYTCTHNHREIVFEEALRKNNCVW